MKHIFVINPNAGKRNRENGIRAEIEKICTQEKLDYSIISCKNKDEARREIVKEAEKGTEILRFYAVGGDGTLSFVANCIYGYENTQLTMLPSGTGNDFPKSFSASENFGSITKLIYGKETKVDAIVCNDKICLNLLNIGFDAEAVRETDKIKRHSLIPGKLAYVLGLIRCLIKLPTVKLEIKLENSETLKNEYLLFVAANGCFYGGGFKAGPNALLDDGLADILTVKRVSRIKFLSLVSKYKKGTLINTSAFEKLGYTSRADHFTLQSDDEFLLCLDGELFSVKKAEIHILRRAFSFIIPQESNPINEVIINN